MLDIEQPQPALLSQREPDHAAELDQLRLAEMPVHALPERIVGIEMPGDRLGIGQRRLLALAVVRGLLEVQEVVSTWSSMMAPLVVALTERWLPQYSQFTERDT